jgi:ABC-2 type transport system permease protein
MTTAVAHGRHRLPTVGGHELPHVHPGRAAARLTTRLIVRGTVLFAVVLAVYVVIEVYTFHSTYPDQMSRSELDMFERTPAVRMLQGPPHGLDSAGGFTAWDGGWMLCAAVAVWALLVSTRRLRGDEDDDRVAVFLAAPLRPRTLAAVQLAVIWVACGVFALSVAAALGLSGEAWDGATLFGLTIGGFAATFAAVGAVCAQILDTRRRALSAGAWVFGGVYAMRMVANSADERAWLRRFTPWGWLDEVEPFAAQRVWAVAAFWLTAVALGAAAVVLRGYRDTGGAFVTMTDRRSAHLRWLGSPVAFTWRESRAVLLAWAVGLGAWAVFLGALLGTMLDFLAADEAYRRVLEEMNMSMLLTADGYVGVMSVLFGLAFALYAAWRMGAARADEASGRLDAFLVRVVTRRRWLCGHLGLALAGVLLLASTCGVATWAGAQLSGAELAVAASLRSTLNQIPVALFFAGVATLVLGVAPKFTLTLPASLAAVGYLVELVGPGLNWPGWTLNLSPFHHLPYVPAEPFLVTPALTLTAVGLLAATVGVEAFHRRDLVAE